MTIELRLLAGVAYRGREVTAPRLRGLLALLASDLRRGSSVAWLVEGLWPQAQPENPTKALQILVSRARSQLGTDVIASTATGYRLNLDEDQVDTSAVVAEASAAAKHARAGDHEAALAHAEAGLALFEGEQGGDGTDPVSMLRAERAVTRESLERARALTLARLGRHEEAIEPLSQLLTARPRDEELLFDLLRSEAATAGSAAALSRYDSYRRSLRDDLGTDPGADLQALHHQLLRGETPVVRHGVSHEPNALLGREADIAALTRLLRVSRVASIVGPGGLGKTRLAHTVSREAEQRVVHFVELASVTRDEDVAGEVASVLGADTRRPALGRLAVAHDIVGGIVAAIGPGPALLVLDNCEHVVQGAAELVRALVSMTGDLRILTTSRTPLGISSESVYPLPELTLPTTVELFEQRAMAARPDVDLPAPVVAELCRHLDGLPLAVELAAARVRVMSVADIARRLDDRFALLRGGSRDTPQRHRTLHAVVDWSWNLLDASGQQALRMLSIFPSGFTAAAAQVVLDDEDALRTVEHLVDQSLLKVTDTPTGIRLRMLETVREFGAAQRTGNDEIITGFLAWARDFGLAHYESVFGLDPFVAAARIQEEQDNLLLALRYAIDRQDGATVAATGAVLATMWTVTSNYIRLLALDEDVSWLLSHFRPAGEFVEATRAVTVMCTTATFMLRNPRATRSLATLRRLPPAPPDTLVKATETVLLATPEAVLAMCDSDEPLLAGVANGLATYIWERQRELPKALAAAERMIEKFPALPWTRLIAHSRAAELSLQLDRIEDTRTHLTTALDVLGPWPDPIGLTSGLVLVNMQLGDFDEAERFLRRDEASQTDDAAMITFHLGARAEIMLARGQTDAGLRMWRLAVDKLACSGQLPYEFQPADLDPWLMEVQSAAVVAHIRAGHFQQIKDIAATLPAKVSRMLTAESGTLPSYVMEFPVCGTVLVALANVDIERGAMRLGARMIALAERLRFVRNFQPTMSARRVTQTAENADKAAYDDAVSSYAAMDQDELRAAALAALRASAQWQPADAAHVR